MKNFLVYHLVLVVMLILTSCDPEVCSFSKVINETEYRVTLKLYFRKPLDGSFDVKNIHIEPLGSTDTYESWKYGTAPSRFSFLAVNFFGTDSLDVVFNDTLSLRYFNQCCVCVIRNPLDDGCFEPLPGQANTYAYRITEADYQQALELYPGK